MDNAVDSDEYFKTPTQAVIDPNEPVDSDAYFSKEVPTQNNLGIFGQKLNPGTTTPVDSFQQDVKGAGLQDATIPDMATVYGLGNLAKTGISALGKGGQAIVSLFETPESLKSAGITPLTLEHMAPGGQNPADYVIAVENQLKAKDALGTTAKETWDKMSQLANSAGQAISNAKIAIQKATPAALMVDAKLALDPIANEALKRGIGLFSKTENLANPFYDAYDGLMKIAQQQGGKLTIDNLDAALQETGQIMNEGGEAVQNTFGKLYGKLADARDAIVNNVADQAGDQGLKEALLKNNADYSTYMRLLPSVEKNAYKEAVKEGISAYQKHIGPLGEKLAIAGGSYAVVRELMDKLMGGGK